MYVFARVAVKKGPHTGWLKATEMYSLMILGAQKSKMKVSKGWFLFRLLGRVGSMTALSTDADQQSLPLFGL